MDDIFIIGGGINGAGIARDAAGRGYRVTLAESVDLASGTSNWSSKLVHGGVRYLEHYEFGLVRKALKEREVIWAIAPHIVHPMRFIMPHHPAMRPAWMLRAGLFLYDNIGGRKLLPGTKTIDLTRSEYGRPLKPFLKKGYQYSDAQVDDARLTVLNALDAHERGATVLVGHKVVEAAREGDGWRIVTDDGSGPAAHRARLIVNAAGPWVDQVLGEAFGRNDVHNIRLVQGSHIVVPRLFDHDNAYIFQNADERIIFAIPFTHDTTLIGTTDRDYEGDPRDVAITQEETDYLCASASEYFAKPVTKDDIVWTYSGVRPLYDDGATAAQEATRDYIFRTDRGPDDAGAPVVNIFGGKITTYRELSTKMMEEVGDLIGAKGREWTGDKPLPGGDFPVQGFEKLVAKARADWPFVPEATIRRLARAYGTRMAMVLAGATSMEDLGHHFGADLYENEVRYLMTNEWARTAQDVVERRSKLTLVMADEEVAALDDWMTAERAA